jgi:phage shock protein PspC (stress-responsive transcriptional regulator)
MTFNDFIRKLTSRKFWLAVAGVATGVAVALGADATEIESVAGTITALLSAVGYIIAEGKVDEANARLKR